MQTQFENIETTSVTAALAHGAYSTATRCKSVLCDVIPHVRRAAGSNGFMLGEMAAHRHIGLEESLHRGADVRQVEKEGVVTIYGVQLEISDVVVARILELLR